MKTPSFGVVIATEKLEDAIHYFFFRINRRDGSRTRQRIARKKPLIEHLAAAKGVAGNIPGETEQFHAILRRRIVGREILLDMVGKRALEIGLGRRQHEAARP